MQNLASKDPARAALFEAMLTAPDEKAFEQTLLAHGRVQDDEIPILARDTLSGHEAKRRNATRLLTTRVANSALAATALSDRVRDTPDLQVWAVATLCLLETPAYRSQAATRTEFIKKALQSKDVTELRAGLAAGLIAGDPATRAALRSALEHPDDGIRKVAIAALAATGDPSSEPLLRAYLATERLPGPLTEIVAALASSNSPDAKSALREALLQADVTKSVILINALHDQLKKARPWVSELLIELAGQRGFLRKPALDLLAEQDLPQQLVPLCIKLYEETPPIDDPQWTENLLCRQPCDRYLSQLAARPLQGSDALAFAQKWLQEHSKPGPT